MTQTPPELYDVNFCFPVRELESDRLKLTPFIPSLHAEPFFSGTAAHPELYAHLPFGPFSSSAHFISTFIETRIQPDPALVLFAVLDKASSQLAGTIGLLYGSPAQRSVEIGFIIILPTFQRTGLAAHAAALLLQYTIALPREGGLGLRRVQWQTSSLNNASVGVATRMGFQKEAFVRWERAMPAGKAGRVREEDGAGLSRDTIVLAVCWDDWESGGVRERVAEILAGR